MVDFCVTIIDIGWVLSICLDRARILFLSRFPLPSIGDFYLKRIPGCDRDNGFDQWIFVAVDRLLRSRFFLFLFLSGTIEYMLQQEICSLSVVGRVVVVDDAFFIRVGMCMPWNVSQPKKKNSRFGGTYDFIVVYFAFSGVLISLIGCFQTLRISLQLSHVLLLDQSQVEI